ncbi:tetratricopeptide repeat protein [Deefgea rivuli]|uniref:tetratricopeptide repeat protein n=1 Tax=Deefgea rivuli TaxID=400948 RepID=UPI000485927B|nr:tetratricopeptide repeat protein [Deefgea rivuli]
MNHHETQIRELLERSKSLTYVNPQESIQLAIDASALAAQGCDPQLHIAVLHQQMSMLFAFGQIHEGCHVLLPALVIAEKHNLEAERGDLLHHLGVAHYTLGEYVTAIDYWSDCLNLGHAEFSSETRINAHIGIGQIYFACSKFTDALRHHQWAERWLSPAIDDELRARLLINVAADLYELEQYTQALDTLNEAEEITQRINHLEYLGEVFSYKTLIALANEQYPEALRLINAGQRLVHFWAWGEISWHIVKARTQQSQGELNEAITTFTRALEMATRMGCGHKVFIIHKFLAQVFRELGQAKAAEYHHKLYQENFHRLLDPQLFKRLAELEAELANYG